MSLSSSRGRRGRRRHHRSRCRRGPCRHRRLAVVLVVTVVDVVLRAAATTPSPPSHRPRSRHGPGIPPPEGAAILRPHPSHGKETPMGRATGGQTGRGAGKWTARRGGCGWDGRLEVVQSFRRGVGVHRIETRECPKPAGNSGNAIPTPLKDAHHTRSHSVATALWHPLAPTQASLPPCVKRQHVRGNRRASR